ncbi:RagB/SusD family nutrient uptake outer membrane protein [Chitinophaga niabensis]|uniref:SusD family protein n=1 Tax=Chitinophaga niabensis TaxID=536979 RepID=A0A1N6D4U9_9BACT|nr:RagB/SusD family nutrient uptake outer membrane protein [Chitinophaga niabensis]SIN65848.1 SusD family protein [Chitinophaga niabensis]
MQKILSNIIVILGITLGISGCSKLIDVDNPSTEIVTLVVFQDSTTAYAALNGIYTSLSGTLASTLMIQTTLTGGLTADELTSFNSSDAIYYNNAIVATDLRFVLGLWQYSYNIIYQSNLLIEGTTNSDNLPVRVKNEIIGQSKFFRAFFHFYLLNYYGAIPLVTSTDVYKNAVLSRSETGKVYEQIIADLKDAADKLSNSPTATKNRVTKYAVSALLARVYLYQKNWDLAIAECDKVLSSNLFTPLSTPATTFQANNKETIFEIQTQNGFTALGTNFVPAATTPSYVLIDDMATSFETGDLRKTNWTNPITYSGKNYLYPFKYKKRVTTTGAAAENAVLLRSAELFLIRSECYVHKNSFDNANTDLSTIRQRAGLIPIPGPLTEPLLLQSIAKERRSELFAEWSHRWFDLKRTNAADSVLTKLKKDLWNSTDALYPIPQNERNKNPNLSQNTGYN